MTKRCVTKMCVKDCVCDKEVCERWCVTKWRRWYVEEKWAEEEQERDLGGADPKNKNPTQ